MNDIEKREPAREQAENRCAFEVYQEPWGLIVLLAIVLAGLVIDIVG